MLSVSLLIGVVVVVVMLEQQQQQRFVLSEETSPSSKFESELRKNDEPWDLDAPCQPYIQKFADAASNVVRCASSFSTPPKVCTTCVNEYIAFKQSQYQLHHLVNVTSFDNTSCSRVIFSNYLISYIAEISDAIEAKIWTQSRCSSCVKIEWKFEENATMYAYTKNVYHFERKLFEWRHCIMNYSSDDNIIVDDFLPLSIISTNFSSLCENCLTAFNSLFHFYWDVYVEPNIDFCVDVETTMNDTMNVWHNVWGCVDNTGKDRQRDWTFIIFSFAILTTLTVLFYLGSYVQSERTQRTLVQYSHLAAPHGLRSRILSSSALPDEIATHSDPQQTPSNLPTSTNPIGFSI